MSSTANKPKPRTKLPRTIGDYVGLIVEIHSRDGTEKLAVGKVIQIDKSNPAELLIQTKHTRYFRRPDQVRVIGKVPRG